MLLERIIRARAKPLKIKWMSNFHLCVKDQKAHYLYLVLF